MRVNFAVFSLLFTIFSSNGFAQEGEANKDTIRQYYSRLARSENDNDKRLLETLLYKKIESKSEQDLRIATRYFYWLKKPNVGDSLRKVSIELYPLGEEARDKELNLVYDEQDANRKEQVYLQWVAKFPPSKKWEDNIPYDYAAYNLAQSLFEAGNKKKGMTYAAKITSPIWAPDGFSGLAEKTLQGGDTVSAAKLARIGLTRAQKYFSSPKSELPGATEFVKAAFINSNYILSQIAYQQKKYRDALTYAKLAHDSSERASDKIAALYSNVLAALGKNQQAYDVLLKIIEGGETNAEIKASFQKSYVKLKGSDAGYKELMADLDKKMVEKVAHQLAGQMINTPAPDFTLTDVNGDSVSLSALKGKTVVLDFWATWCVPCKRSFPAMKRTMEKYKNDSSITFLFIHTWEKEENATAAAKKYIADNNYPFRVLMDLKDAKSGMNKVVGDYGVDGIPAKFVIDKRGNIRFKFIGGSQSEDVAVEEVVTMIEMTQKG